MENFEPLNKRKLLLIGLAGKARVGKDTVGEYLENYHLFQRYAFAGPLKKAVCEMFGITMNYFNDPELKEKVIPFWGYSPRQMAQLLGTEGGRELFDKNIWIKRAQREWDSLLESAITMTKIDRSLGTAIQGMVVTDVRFDNEADWIRDQGGTVWHIQRHDAYEVSNHVSESGVVVKIEDMHIRNNGTLEDLYMNVDLILAHMLLPYY